MAKPSLMTLSYKNTAAKVMLTNYADTLVYGDDGKGKTLYAVRFGGYPEQVRAMADAIYGGATIAAEVDGTPLKLKGLVKRYRRQLGHSGVYAEATMIAEDETLRNTGSGDEDDEDDAQEEITSFPPRKAFIFCHRGDENALFEEVDQKTAVPLIPEFQGYLLTALKKEKILQQLQVVPQSRNFEAWMISFTKDDQNIVDVVERGLRSGAISIPGAVTGLTPLDGVNTVTEYLNTFGVTVAQRIKDQFNPLFDPSVEPLSPEILAINDYIKEKAGYSLYDAQLAVAESVKRRLGKGKVALIIAECGSGKSKIGSVAMGAAAGLRAAHAKKGKAFNLVLCPSHVTEKWVREIEETLPDTFASVVHSITEFDRLYALYEQSGKSCYAILSKEKARDGYMRQPCAVWNKRKKAFVCPSCGEIIEMDISEDGCSYMVNADQFFFMNENRKNHVCRHCGGPLWTAANPDKKTGWIRIGEYGFVYRYGAAAHIPFCNNAAREETLRDIAEHPDAPHPAARALRAYPLSTYIKKKYRGRIDGLICDELHQYAQNSGQGEAMGELFQAADKVIGMTATLINGYASGIFYLLFRIAAPLMKKDGKEFDEPNVFSKEYGVTQSITEIREADYNSNRRTPKIRSRTRQLPGVSPLVYSRFLLEYAVFLSLLDMGKDLPEYEEIPVPLAMPEPMEKIYRQIEDTFVKILCNRKDIANKVQSSFLNLLTAYPDQPYGHTPILNPKSDEVLVAPTDAGSDKDMMPKDEALLEIVDRKIAQGEKVMIYTNWTRLDTQKKVHLLLTKRGYRTHILPASVSPAKREAWVEKRLAQGMQVMIVNPTVVETGLDLNAFTTLVFYDTGYKLFTLRQASRRSWRINQLAPRVEVYMFYYQHTAQHKAIKLMANKLAVAGIIEGQMSDEGLAAMSECEDMLSLMAKELSLGIRDSVEDVSATFKKMALLKPPEEKQEPSVLEAPAPTVAEPEQQTITAYQKPAPPERPLPLSLRKKSAAGGMLFAEEDIFILSEPLQKPAARRKKPPQVDENQITLFDLLGKTA